MSSVLDEVVAVGQVKGGKLLIRSRRAFDAQIKHIPEKWMLEVVVKRLRATRSIQANRFYWGVCLRLLSEHTGYTVDELHDVLKMKFLPKALAMNDGNGEVKGEFVVGGSTRKLNTAEFHEYVERVRQFAAELDCVIPDPGEIPGEF